MICGVLTESSWAGAWDSNRNYKLIISSESGYTSNVLGTGTVSIYSDGKVYQNAWGSYSVKSLVFSPLVSISPLK